MHNDFLILSGGEGTVWQDSRSVLLRKQERTAKRKVFLFWTHILSVFQEKFWICFKLFTTCSEPKEWKFISPWWWICLPLLYEHRERNKIILKIRKSEVNSFLQNTDCTTVAGTGAEGELWDEVSLLALRTEVSPSYQVGKNQVPLKSRNKLGKYLSQ